MSDTRIPSILQRLPLILDVTAASYGLAMQHRDVRVLQDPGMRETAAQQAQGAQHPDAKAA